MTVEPRINASSGGHPHLGRLFHRLLCGFHCLAAFPRNQILSNRFGLPFLRHPGRQTLRNVLRVVWIVLVMVTGSGTHDTSAASIQPAASRAPRDLQGRTIDPLKSTTARATVLLFVQTDCPISNRYAPEVKRLYDRFSSQHIAFHLVYPDPAQTPEKIRAHLKLYQYPCAAIRDPHHVLVAKAGATVTPEAAVFVGSTLVYRGRIDDRFIDFGRARPEPSQRDLENVLAQVARGESLPFHTTPALGCFISDMAP